MRRRDWLLLPAALGPSARVPAQPAAAAQPVPAATVQPVPAQPAAPPCATRPARLGRGFHLGEVFGRTRDDYRQIAATGATLVRLGIALQPDAAGRAYEMPAQALPELLRQLDHAAATGLRLVLVLRPAPEPDAPLWTRAALQDSLADHWRRLARQLAGRAEVAAFDLVNEAHPPGSTMALKQARWLRLAERLALEVRAQDAARTLIVEPSPGARPLAFDTAAPLALDNVVYSVHMYEPFAFTHQRVGDPRFDGVVDYPGPVRGDGEWNRQRLQAVLAPVRRFGDSHGVEIYVGEFGAVRWAPAAARERYLRDLLAIFDDWGWSWTYHAWREWHGWDAEMDGATAPGERRRGEPAYALLRGALGPCRPAGGGR